MAKPDLTDKETLAGILSAEYDNCYGTQGDEWSDNRQKAFDYYTGAPRGDEVKGRSKVVSRDVAEVVDSTMPGLIDIFYSGDIICRYEANGREDEDKAQIATEYANYIVQKRNDGFNIFYSWFWDALVYRLGIVKAWYDEKVTSTVEEFDDVDPETLQSIYASLSEQGFDEIEPLETEEEIGLDGQPRYSIKVKVTKKSGYVRIETVPPEEFFVSKGARNLAEATLVGHRRRLPIGDIVAMGLGTLDELSEYSGTDDADYDEERIQREELLTETPDETDWNKEDESRKPAWLYECYLRGDFGGKGIPELRRVFAIGSDFHVLKEEAWDVVPFATLTPKPIPHSIMGRSFYDDVSDIQDIHTALQRGLLDNSYLINNTRYKVLKGMVDIDDLMTPRVGGYVQVETMNALEPLMTPNIMPAIQGAIEHMMAVREQRTGVTRYNQGLDADSLNKTATGVQIITQASQQRQKLVAKTFAETGVKQLFVLVLHLMLKHQNKPEVVRLTNRWVTVDPREWQNLYDVSVQVGIGTGTKDQLLQSLFTLSGVQEKVIQMQGGVDGPLVTIDGVYAVLAQIEKAVGIKGLEAFQNPALAPPAPPQEAPPDPKIIKLQQEGELQKAELELKAQKAQMQDQLQRDKMKQNKDIAAAQIMAKVAKDMPPDPDEVM